MLVANRPLLERAPLRLPRVPLVWCAGEAGMSSGVKALSALAVLLILVLFANFLVSWHSCKSGGGEYLRAPMGQYKCYEAGSLRSVDGGGK